jgi:hypothetical protein
MQIIIDVDEKYSSRAVIEYLKCISIDQELINSITFKN